MRLRRRVPPHTRQGEALVVLLLPQAQSQAPHTLLLRVLGVRAREQEEETQEEVKEKEALLSKWVS